MNCQQICKFHTKRLSQSEKKIFQKDFFGGTFFPETPCMCCNCNVMQEQGQLSQINRATPLVTTGRRVLFLGRHMWVR